MDLMETSAELALDFLPQISSRTMRTRRMIGK
jgi:hypothetical protein